MKKKLLFVFFILLPCYTYSQIKTCEYYDGYWGYWQDHYYVGIHGNYSGFIFYYTKEHPSEYSFKFAINSYVQPDKQEIKRHWKNKEWYEYTGVVEYYLDEENPTIKDVLKKWKFPVIHKKYSTQKKIVKAIIKIAPYKNHPKVYNFWFDGVGFAIDLNNAYF